MLRIMNMPDVRGVAAGASFTVNLPVGWTYESITLEMGGTTFTRAQLEDLELRVNGKPIMFFDTGTDLDALNDYYGRSDTANFLTLHLRRREFDDLVQDRICRLGTADVQTLSLHGTIAAGASAPTLAVHAVVDDVPEPMGLVCKVKRFSYNAAGTSFEIPDLPRGPRVMAAHFNKSDVNDVECEVNGVKVLDCSKTLGEVIQKENGRAPVTATYTHADFCLDGDIYSALVTDPRVVKDWRFRLTLGAAGAIPVYVEYLDGFDGI